MEISTDKKRAKGAAWFLVIGGIIIITAGILRLRGVLYKPFQVTDEPVSFVSIGGEGAISSNQDTDKDGLSDADEMTNYLTSPFLADTDSDGTSDGDEIKAQTDPTCPAGRDCAKQLAETPEVKSSVQDLVGPTGLKETGSLADLLNISGTSNAQENLDPAAVRESLKIAGVAEALLNQLDDASVIDLYKKTVVSTGVTPEQIAGSSPVKMLGADELRALLVRAGVDAKKLEKLTDEQLVQLVEETLKGDVKK